MNTRHLFLATTALTLALTGSLRAADIDGKWKCDFTNDYGHQTYVLDLKADGEKLTGKGTAQRDDQSRNVELKEGKIAGTNVTFVETLNVQDNDIRIEFKGGLKGDEIKMTRSVGDFGTAEVVFKRVKETSGLAGKWTSEFDSQIGQQKYTFDFKLDGEKLTGKGTGVVSDQTHEFDLKEGKVTGQDVFFVENFKFQDNDIRIEYKGKVSGDEIKFTRKVGDIASEEIVAKRATPAAK